MRKLFLLVTFTLIVSLLCCWAIGCTSSCSGNNPGTTIEQGSTEEGSKQGEGGTTEEGSKESEGGTTEEGSKESEGGTTEEGSKESEGGTTEKGTGESEGGTKKETNLPFVPA